MLLARSAGNALLPSAGLPTRTTYVTDFPSGRSQEAAE